MSVWDQFTGKKNAIGAWAESTHTGPGGRANAATLSAGNKDRSIALPEKFTLEVELRLLGERVANKDESRNRFGRGQQRSDQCVKTETVITKAVDTVQSHYHIEA
eukprot:SAG31_NODE_3809_length_3863_cov_2.881775_4_plen_105_part_00